MPAKKKGNEMDSGKRENSRKRKTISPVQVNTGSAQSTRCSEQVGHSGHRENRVDNS